MLTIVASRRRGDISTWEGRTFSLGDYTFYETFEKEEADRLLSRIHFHYTPKHASWLDMAEIELSILSRMAIKCRVPTEKNLIFRVQRFQDVRNEKHSTINWKFTKADARKVFKYDAGKLNELPRSKLRGIGSSVVMRTSSS